MRAMYVCVPNYLFQGCAALVEYFELIDTRNQNLEAQLPKYVSNIRVLFPFDTTNGKFIIFIVCIADFGSHNWHD